MLGVVEALATALLWGVSAVSGARAARLVGARAALAWVLLIGLVVVLPFAAARGVPDVSARAWGWCLLSGVASVAGLGLMYAAMRIGQVSLVTPIVSTQGAVAALLALLAGEQLQPLAIAALAVIVGGMLLAMRRPAARADAPHDPTWHARHRRSLLLALTCAGVFGVALFASARGGSAVGAAWLLLSVRTVGVLALTLPLALRGRLAARRAMVPFVVFSGIAEVVAFAFYIDATDRIGVAVPAVISSQFAVVAALVGMASLDERLSRRQLTGIAAIVAGVAVVAAVQ